MGMPVVTAITPSAQPEITDPEGPVSPKGPVDPHPKLLRMARQLRAMALGEARPEVREAMIRVYDCLVEASAAAPAHTIVGVITQLHMLLDQLPDEHLTPIEAVRLTALKNAIASLERLAAEDRIA